MAHAKGTHLGGVNSLAALRDRCHVDEESDCWCWRLYKTESGLAMVRLLIDGRHTKSLGRRAALILAGKKPPTAASEAYAADNCTELSCCNPKHARWGTRSERMQLASERGAFRDRNRLLNLRRCAQAAAKLTQDQRAEVATSAEPASEVAARLGVSAGRVNQLRRGASERAAPRSVFEWRP
jgi:hypothetical protein